MSHETTFMHDIDADYVHEYLLALIQGRFDPRSVVTSISFWLSEHASFIGTGVVLNTKPRFWWFDARDPSEAAAYATLQDQLVYLPAMAHHAKTYIRDDLGTSLGRPMYVLITDSVLERKKHLHNMIMDDTDDPISAPIITKKPLRKKGG